MRTFQALTLCLGLMLALPTSGGAAEPENAATAQFSLNHASASDAVVFVRAIAGVRQVDVLSDHELRIRDTPDRLEVAKQVVTLLDSPADSSLSTFTVPNDQSVVAGFRLERTDPRDVMVALRTVLRIANVAAQQETRLVIVRDSLEQTDSARALVEILEQRCL